MEQAEQKYPLVTKKWFLILFGGLLGMGILFFTMGYAETYRFFGVPVSKFIFLDMQLITGSAESIEDGFDPLVQNLRDPGQRIFNYPKIWFAFLRLGFGNGALMFFGISAIALFFIALFLFPKTDDNLTLIVLFLVTFSSASLLGYERANVDLLFFAGIVFALLLRGRFQAISMLIMMGSISFKIFPVFALGLYWDKKEPKSMLPVMLLSIASLVYFAFILNDMRTMFETTQKGSDISYGLSVAAYHLKETGQIDKINNLILYSLAAILSATVVIAGLLGRENLAELKNYHLQAFWAGAGIYAGTFWLGNNWDYRLIFLILVIPAMVGFSRYSKGIGRYIGWITVLAIIISCWGYGVRLRLSNIHEIREILYWIDECFNWIVYLGLVYFFMASIPKWLIPQKISHYLRQGFIPPK